MQVCKWCAIGVGMLILAASPPSLAKAPTSAAGSIPDTSVLKNLTDCRKLATKDARADCYDAAVDDLDRAQTAGQVVIIDQAKLQTARRQAFGFNLPSLTDLFKSSKQAPIDVISLRVKSAYENADERWVMETEEQAVWRQTQSSGFALTPHPGSMLEIRPGALGGFFCKIDRQAPFRCRRDQ